MVMRYVKGTSCPQNNGGFPGNVKLSGCDILERCLRRDCEIANRQHLLIWTSDLEMNLIPGHVRCL